MGIAPHPSDTRHPKPRLLDRMRSEMRVRHYSIRTIQELLGHKDVKTTMIYTHVLNISGGKGIVSSVGSLLGSGEARP